MATPLPQAPRILTRGEQHQFRVKFFADSALTTPLVPLDPTYPAYSIKAPDGTEIQAGVGTLVAPGEYKLDFLVPKDAPLSYFNQTPQQFNDKGQGMELSADHSRYRIEWFIVTAENFQVREVDEFDVRDHAVTQSKSRELKYLTMAGDPLRILYRDTVLPYKVTMRLYLRGSNGALCEEVFDSSQPVGSQGNVRWAKDGDSYVIYYDIAEGNTQANTAYVILWTIMETPFSVPETEHQIITAISINALPLITSLRMLIDRFQKRLGRVQAFEDSDLLEYISQGLRLVNLGYPTTNYPLDSMPDILMSLVLLAAGWYGLQAQSLLENDLQFNFSGQSVTLSVDRQSGLDAVAGRMMEMFNTQIGPAKLSLVRRAQGVGTVAGRAYSYRRMYNFVYKIDSVQSNMLLKTISAIGLL